MRSGMEWNGKGIIVEWSEHVCFRGSLTWVGPMSSIKPAGSLAA